MANQPEPKPIVMTIAVYPPRKGQRQIVVSGAPEGELPAVRSGVFADLHQMINQMWMELIKRKPQVPRGRLTSQGPADAGQGDAPAGDQLVASNGPGGAYLPVIEEAPAGAAQAGDQLVASTQGDAPALTSLDETEEDTSD